MYIDSDWYDILLYFDNLLLKVLPEKYNLEKDNLYDRLLHICHFVSMLTDGNALLFNKMISTHS